MRRRTSLHKLAKILVASTLGVGVPIAALFQNFMETLWFWLGWLAVGMYFLLQYVQPLLDPLGSWLKGIIEYLSSFLESSPTPEFTVIYIVLAIVIIVLALIVNMLKPKPAFVDELEAKYDRPPENIKSN